MRNEAEIQLFNPGSERSLVEIGNIGQVVRIFFESEGFFTSK